MKDAYDPGRQGGGAVSRLCEGCGYTGPEVQPLREWFPELRRVLAADACEGCAEDTLESVISQDADDRARGLI